VTAVAASSVGGLLAEARTCLAHCDTPRLDAEILLGHSLRKAREYLIANPQARVEVAARAQFLRLIAQRAQGVPVAYLTGHREFWSLDLQVTTATLIPRPETEILVARALDAIGEGAFTNVLDLGTGCGAIAVAIGRECPQCRVFGVDCSAEAVAVAKLNATRLGIDNVRFFTGNWFEPFPGIHFDLIVGNPPYVCSDDPALAVSDLQYEPEAALLAGPDGLDAIRAILAGVTSYLRPGGKLLLEHGDAQGPELRRFYAELGFEGVRTFMDLAERERVTAGSASGL